MIYNKRRATRLALFFGFVGAHMFYLNNTKDEYVRLILCSIFWFLNIKIGILILVFLAWKDAYEFSNMTAPEFDIRYNNSPTASSQYEPKPVFQQSKNTATVNTYKTSGYDKYKAYDIPGAIEDFNKSLIIEPNDRATHFNLACAYSWNEEAEKALFHLDEAIRCGFDDWEKIETHEGLAYLRTQTIYLQWKANGNTFEDKDQLPQNDQDLLEQVRILNQKRQDGTLGEEEYQIQREKLWAR